MTHRIGIFVFDRVEVLDFAGPYEVFTTATRVNGRLTGAGEPLFDVVTIAASTNPVTARAGLRVLPDFSVERHPRLDCLVVPGGVVTDELEKSDVIEWIAAQATQAGLVASVCTGAFLLAKAGVLAGKSATTHWEDIDDLRSMFPALPVRTGVRWVDQGNVVTSAGISAGIDMSLHLVERLAGRWIAERTAHQMEFDWVENPC
ncbi:MAG: DJ-1/PfpI family protein [Pseudomonadota bacterium]